MPLAYFLTWRCYGTWLPGDPRGSVDPFHNRYRSKQAPGDPRLEEAAALSMRENPVLLGAAMRAVVVSTVQNHCTMKGWRLMALNV